LDKTEKKYKILAKKYKDLKKEFENLNSDYKSVVNSENRLLQLFEFAPEAYYLNDLRGNFIDGNQAAADLLGYKKEELIGKNFMQINLLRKDQLIKAAANLSKNVLGKATGPDEFVLVSKTGKEIFVEISTKPIKLNGKRIVLGAARDISKRKIVENELQAHRDKLEKIVMERTDELQAVNQELLNEISERKIQESALRESEQKFRSFVETSADIVFQVSKDGKIEFVSPRVKEMYGYEDNELLGQYLSQTTPDFDIPRAMRAIKSVFKGKPLKNFELHQHDRDGRIQPMEINAIPLKQGDKIVGLRGIMRNISERKKAEKILRESEERYRDLVENANIGILIDNADGSFRYFNKKFAEFFGYSLEEMKHQNVNTLVHKDDLERVLNYHNRRTQGKKARSLYEFRGQRKDGAVIYLEVHAAAIKEDNKFAGSRSFMWDITSRKNAENARIKSEKKYRELFNNMRDGSVIISLKGEILAYNSAFLKLTGFKAREISKFNWFDLSSSEWRKAEQEIVQTQVLKKKYSKIYEKELERGDGSLVPVELRAYLIDHDLEQEAQIWFIVRDISQRKRIENEVLMLAQSVRSVRECICVTDMDENFLFVNDAFVKTYGFKRKELIGKHISMIRFEDYDSKIFTATHKGGWKGELTNRKKDGTIFPIYLSTSLIKDEKNNPVAMIGVSSDITEDKQFEEKFRQVQKMEAIGQLAGGIAHDFNNILTAINGYAELALMKMESRNPLFKEITGILKAGKRASGLVRQLLAFSRQQMIEPKVIEVNHLIVDLDRMLRRLIGEDINVEIKLDTNLGNIKADPGQLEQILVNIVVNGRDAINQRTSISGEKKITIETSNVYLDKQYVKAHPGSREGMHICVAVSDTGIGMNKEIQSKVFEPFFTTKDKIKGTGLGLATVYGIVKQNNGYVNVYSEVNRGTSVRVYWPMESGDKIQNIKQQSIPDVTGGKETILFVEDNEEVRKFTVTALKTLGYKVLSARHGVEAIKMIEQNAVGIDLIITDVVMPEMGGKELSEKILKRLPDAKILFTSGYTDNHIVHSGTLDEDVNFIHKPFSIEGLSKKIRNVLDQ
jgi:PAS domain S-box-containing protein